MTVPQLFRANSGRGNSSNLELLIEKAVQPLHVGRRCPYCRRVF